MWFNVARAKGKVYVVCNTAEGNVISIFQEDPVLESSLASLVDFVTYSSDMKGSCLSLMLDILCSSSKVEFLDVCDEDENSLYSFRCVVDRLLNTFTSLGIRCGYVSSGMVKHYVSWYGDKITKERTNEESRGTSDRELRKRLYRRVWDGLDP